MTKYAREFYWGFLLVLFICLSPLKMLAYAVPYIFLFYLMIKNIEVRRTMNFIYCLIAVSLVSYLFYYSLYGDTVFQNYLLTLLTYSSFFPVFIIDNRQIAQPALVKKILGFLAVVFLLEGLFGISQAMYGAVILHSGFDINNGDFVQGTITPGYYKALNFSNPMFIANMTFMGLSILMLYFVYGYKKKLTLFIGFLCIIFGSVIHILMLSFASAVLFYIVIRPEFVFVNRLKATIRRQMQRLSVKIFIWVFLAFVVVVPIVFLTTNIKLISSFVEKTILGDTPKAKITVDAFTTIPEEFPSFPIVGFGPGQFTSRASLIGSGYFLGGVDNPKPLPLLDKKMNPEAQKIVFPLLVQAQQDKYLGSTGFPHYSWLTVYSETGMIGFFLVTFFVVYLLYKAIKRASKSKEHRFVAYIFCTGLGLLYLLGIQVNYWEVPQAIFVGVLLLKLLYANLMNLDTFEDRKMVLIEENDLRQLVNAE